MRSLLLLLSVGALELLGCASPDSEAEETEASALSADPAASQLLAESPWGKGNVLRVAVDPGGAVWLADRSARTVRMVGNASRYVFTAPPPAWGVDGPWFSGSGMLTLHSGSEAFGTDVFLTAPGQASKRLTYGLIDTVGIDGDSVIVAGQRVAGEAAAAEVQSGDAVVRFEPTGAARVLAIAPQLGRSCATQKIVVTRTQVALLKRCVGEFGAIVSVPKVGGEARVVFKTGPYGTVEDMAATTGDLVYIVEQNGAASGPVSELSLDTGVRKPVATAFFGRVAWSDGVLYLGDADGRLSARSAAKGVRELGTGLSAIEQLEAAPDGVVALTRSAKNEARVVRFVTR